MLAAEVWPGGYRLVAPDNGTLTDVLGHAERVEIREITNAALTDAEADQARPGLTVLGPAAAHLAAGTPLAAAGELVRGVESLPRVKPTVAAGSIRGSVVYVDNWGNLRTNIPERLLTQAGLSRGDKLTIQRPGGAPEVAAPWVGTYDDGSRGTLLVLRTIGTETIEIAVAYGDAAKELGLKPGDAVTLARRGGR
jgi:hypothetical protein